MYRPLPLDVNAETEKEEELRIRLERREYGLFKKCHGDSPADDNSEESTNELSGQVPLPRAACKPMGSYQHERG